VQVAQRTEASQRLHEFETLHASLKAEAALVEESAQRYVELEKSMAEVPAPGASALPTASAAAKKQPEQFQIFDDEDDDVDDARSTMDLEAGDVHSRLEDELATEYISGLQKMRHDMADLQGIYTNLAGQTELQSAQIATIESEMMRTTAAQAQSYVELVLANARTQSWYRKKALFYGITAAVLTTFGFNYVYPFG
jgi:hypothetical protein